MKTGRVAYLHLLRTIQPLVVQFSFSTTDDRIGRRLEPRCDPPSALLRSIETLVEAGVNVTCRWQPFVPGVSEKPREFLQRVASAGCRHVGFEHLKLPLERGNPLWQELTKAAGRDLNEEYLQLGASRDGREYVLPGRQKLERVIEVSKYARRFGMTFGAADNEFQHLSDTEACCSGIDQFPGFQNFFRHQIGFAIRKSRGTKIKYATIRDEWTPSGSIDRYLNSKTRIRNQKDCRGTLKDHVLGRWNSPGAPGNPSSFFGVSVATNFSRKRPLIYEWANSSREL
jgi:hypothetical protein